MAKLVNKFTSPNLFFTWFYSDLFRFTILESIYFLVHFLVVSSERPSTTNEQPSTSEPTAGK